VLQVRDDLAVADALQLLDGRTDDVRWRYIHHLVYSRGMGEPELHTELALELIECCLREQGQQGQQQGQQGQQGPGSSSQAAAAGVAPGPSSSHTSTDAQLAVMYAEMMSPRTRSGEVAASATTSATTSATLVATRLGSGTHSTTQSMVGSSALPAWLHAPWLPGSSGSGGPDWSSGSGAGRCLVLRSALLLHLHQSQLYDAAITLTALGDSPLHWERVLLYQRLGQHGEALRVLALVLGDVDACIAYCKQQQQQQQQQHPGQSQGQGWSAQQVWMLLLEIMLRPGDGHEPRYGAAVRVLHAEGGSLSPLQVLQALPDDMPLHLASQTLSGMLASVLHRKRHTQVVRGLTRGQNLAARAHLVELSSQHVLVGDDTVCRGCHRLLGDKVFYRYPTGMIMCGRCVKGHGPADT